MLRRIVVEFCFLVIDLVFSGCFLWT